MFFKKWQFLSFDNFDRFFDEKKVSITVPILNLEVPIFKNLNSYANCLTQNQLENAPKKTTILFVISPTKINQKGLCPLNCRITLNKERKQFTTGLFVNPNYWENKLQKVSTQDSNHKFINSQIEQIQIKINNIVLVFQLQNGDCTLDNIYNKYIGV